MNKYVPYAIKAFLWSCLLLFGWCFALSIPVFFSDVHRVLLFLLLFVYEFFYAGMFTHFDVVLSRRGVRGVPLQDRVLLIGLALQTIIAVVAPYTDAANMLKLPEISTLRTVGVAVFAISVSMMIFSAIKLGALFSKSLTVQKEHPLITSGIYRLLRHPWDVGVILFGFGISLTFLSIIGIILSIGLAATYCWRIREEEAFMEAEFGDDWRAYKERTKKIVPFIY
jgi:protein-S-isoprenylcysteine O-methyltransferase Ste14